MQKHDLAYSQCRCYGGAMPPQMAASPLFHLGLLKILFLEHHSMTRQHTKVEKGIITFKHSSPSPAQPGRDYCRSAQFHNISLKTINCQKTN